MDNEEYLEWLEVHFETPIEQDYHQDTLHELMEFEFEEELWYLWLMENAIWTGKSLRMIL